jgi:hypothetical protein
MLLAAVIAVLTWSVGLALVVALCMAAARGDAAMASRARLGQARRRPSCEPVASLAAAPSTRGRRTLRRTRAS